jgi:hypothetical protein
VFDQFKLSCLLFLPSWNCWPANRLAEGRSELDFCSRTLLQGI